MRYSYLIFDADETLLDFPAAQAKAIRGALEDEGLPCDDDTARRFHEINQRLWRMRERGEVTQEELILRRFEELLAGQVGADARAASEGYLRHLARAGDLLPGALELIRAVKARGAKIAIATNGVGMTQRGRLEAAGLMPYLDALVISEEVGAVKPDPRMIEVALEALGCVDKRQALMIGDAPGTDILGAQRAGVDACWYNPAGAAYPGEVPPTYETREVWAAYAFVLDGDWAEVCFLREKDCAALLMTSRTGGVYCVDGDFIGECFVPGRPWQYDLGSALRGVETWRDAAGLVAQRGRLAEGLATLPREVRVIPGGVRVAPAREVSLLRGEVLLEREDFTIRAGDNALKGIEGRQVELEIDFVPGTNALHLELLRAGASACVRLSYAGVDDSMEADLTSFAGEGPARVGGAVQGEGEVNLRVFLRGPVVEAYVNRRETLTVVARPGEEARGMRLFGEGGVRVKRLRVWGRRCEP